MPPDYRVIWDGTSRLSLTNGDGWIQRDNELLRRAPGTTGYYNLGYEQEKARKVRPRDPKPEVIRACVKGCGRKAAVRRRTCRTCRKRS